MSEHLTYSNLSDEDKLLMDDLFKYKLNKEKDRKIIRSILARLRKIEMDHTREIMNLSQKKIGEKFEVNYCAARPLSKKERKEINKRLGIEDPNEEKSLFHCNNTGTYLLSDKKSAA